MPTTRTEFISFTPFAETLQGHHRRHRAANFSIWRLRFHLIESLQEYNRRSMTIYLSDPFEGDINPGTSTGQKLYTLATADRKKEELVSISQENVSNIMSAFRHDSNSFGWRFLINNIKADDNVTKLKILEDFGKCILTLVKAQASKTWHDYAATTTTPFPTDMVQSTIDPVDNTKPNDKMPISVACVQK